MEIQKQKQTNWRVSAKRAQRYDEIRELIGQMKLIEKYIRIRLNCGQIQKDEDALHQLLDHHRDAVRELDHHLLSLKIRDRNKEYANEEDEEMEEECIESSKECDSYEYDYEYDVVEPTLITKDVLLAHKFNYYPTLHSCERDFGDIKVLIQLACDGGVEYCHIRRRCNTSTWTWNRDEIVLTTIRYVHQMQQALELIGVDCNDTF